MKSKHSFLSLLLLAVVSTQISYAHEPAEALARKAVSEDASAATPAIEELRALGPAGLKVLMDQYQNEIRQHVENPSLRSDDAWQRIANALDTVAQQKNSYIAGLYWHTDLEAAKKAAAAANKPILSLRLLGKLTDEFSCANSRFFRTVLYSNAEISQYLRDHYVLHWQSVRPVPKVTIDYGDGRKLERTLTGNSIHYVLDSQGRLIDAIPGLHGPMAFQNALVTAEDVCKRVNGKAPQAQQSILNNFYRDQHRKITVEWMLGIKETGGKTPEDFKIVNGPYGQALVIAPLAVTKALTETTILRAMTTATAGLDQVTYEDAWQKLAKLHAKSAVLDARSIALIKRQNPALSDEELGRLVTRFQELIALDTVRNRFLMHSKLYTWLIGDPGRNNLEIFNEKVYESLFLTPRSDPWLGLFSSDVYTALDNGGLVKP